VKVVEAAAAAAAAYQPGLELPQCSLTGTALHLLVIAQSMTSHDVTGASAVLLHHEQLLLINGLQPS
jgi:hypothetical protein